MRTGTNRDCYRDYRNYDRNYNHYIELQGKFDTILKRLKNWDTGLSDNRSHELKRHS